VAPVEIVEYVDFEAQHLPGILRLHEAEGWPSLPEDAVRALRSLIAPGVRAVVAVEGDAVRGFACALTDGEVTSYLTNLVVDASARRQGIARELVAEIFRRCGTLRMDLLSEDAAQDFYRALPHRVMPGFRIYSHSGEPSAPVHGIETLP
jgi:ribosomal protein S18 acetylase RimI-like enzyme